MKVKEIIIEKPVNLGLRSEFAAASLKEQPGRYAPSSILGLRSEFAAASLKVPLTLLVLCYHVGLRSEFAAASLKDLVGSVPPVSSPSSPQRIRCGLIEGRTDATSGDTHDASSPQRIRCGLIEGLEQINSAAQVWAGLRSEFAAASLKVAMAGELQTDVFAVSAANSLRPH